MARYTFTLETDDSLRAPWAAEIALPSGAVVRVGTGADGQLLRAVFEALS